MEIPSGRPAIFRSSDVAELNRLLNHPRIRPHVGGEGYADGQAILDAGAMFYLSDQGGAIFHEGEPGIWEGHCLFHGRAPYKLALGMIRALIYAVNPKLLWGAVRTENRAARLFTRKLGFTSLGFRERLGHQHEIFVWSDALNGRNPGHFHGGRKGFQES